MAKQKQYYQDNKKKIQVYNKQYRHDNKTKLQEKKKQYHQNNRTKLLAKHKQWYQDNKAIVSAKKNTRITCTCGLTYTRTNKARHERSKKHQKYLAEQI